VKVRRTSLVIMFILVDKCVIFCAFLGYYMVACGNCGKQLPHCDA
jgi:heme/copper-type cytochrome/quinol oxidase subunit 3